MKFIKVKKGNMKIKKRLATLPTALATASIFAGVFFHKAAIPAFKIGGQILTTVIRVIR